MRYLLKLNGCKFTSAILIVFFVVLVLFSIFMDNQKYTFENVYNDILKLDAKHNATFRTEVIPTRVLRDTRIPPLLEDLEELRDDINSSSAENKEEMAMLVQARISMLKSQQELHNADKLGAKARVDYGVDCASEDLLREAATHYNLTAIYGSKTLNILDKLLTENPELKPIIGTDDNKILFYESDLGYYKRLSVANVEKFREECGKELIS